MLQLNLKPTHKPVRDYYTTLQQYEQHGVTHEGAVSAPFETLLNTCSKQVNATLIPQYAMHSATGDRIVIDGAVLNEYGIPIAYWEAKDIDDDLDIAVQQKREAGYPLDNILFQTPERGILIQNGQTALDLDISEPSNLIESLKYLFAYTAPALDNWQTAVNDFRSHVPELANNLMELIEQRYDTDAEFKKAFTDFYEVCRTAINPNLSRAAVEEMLIQHIITERIFRTVFERSDFTRRNIIAREIENVSDALMRHAVSRDAFLQPLDRFYNAIERAATLCRDFSQKQHFLNTFYEKFFQGFSEDVADTHGIVYTPQPIVDFMVNSVSHILETEFGRSLSDTGVHIIDPFVGTGNFIVRLMRDIQGTALEEKYRHELHCNEVMLLPYYIASLNIEQEFFQRTQTYLPFEGITLADTFELLEDQQIQLFTRENTDRVERQKAADMFVVIGNPPYNMGQVNENDNNKNRKYGTMDKMLKESYSQDSKATNKNALSDPYVKAILWASKRIGEEGIVAFVTNNGFLDGIAFDGMRKHLAQDFDTIYILDLSGNVRKNPKLSGTTHNVFGIQVGVSINFFIKRSGVRADSETAKIFYARVDEFWRKEQKYQFLDSKQHYQNIEWQQVTPDSRFTWLTEGLHAEFDTFTPMGTKAAKAVKGTAVDVIFKTYSRGTITCRDAWTYNFNQNTLTENVSRMVKTYNAEVARWLQRIDRDTEVDDFVVYDDTEISWSNGLKRKLKAGNLAEFSTENIRTSTYRPFTKSHLYFDRIMNEAVYVLPSFFPTPETEKENQVICLPGMGGRTHFWCYLTNMIPNLSIISIDANQCFPFYTYNEDGTNRQENITDWALAEFRKHYGDDTISKWDIFHYTYGILHHPEYREKYQANLKRDLPHIPPPLSRGARGVAPDFWGFANAGGQLADIHVNYESQPKYDGLKYIETPDMPIDWRVEKMKLSKDKTQLVYNDFLTIDGIPSEVFDYRLGTRSALEWIVNQYRVKTDKRSGIVNDPNRADAPRYIVDLIGQVIGVSLQTVEIVEALPDLVGAVS